VLGLNLCGCGVYVYMYHGDAAQTTELNSDDCEWFFLPRTKGSG